MIHSISLSRVGGRSNDDFVLSLIKDSCPYMSILAVSVKLRSLLPPSTKKGTSNTQHTYSCIGNRRHAMAKEALPNIVHCWALKTKHLFWAVEQIATVRSKAPLAQHDMKCGAAVANRVVNLLRRGWNILGDLRRRKTSTMSAILSAPAQVATAPEMLDGLPPKKVLCAFLRREHVWSYRYALGLPACVVSEPCIVAHWDLIPVRDFHMGQFPGVRTFIRNIHLEYHTHLKYSPGISLLIFIYALDPCGIWISIWDVHPGYRH